MGLLDIFKRGKKSLATATNSHRGGWLSIFESFPGAWQRNIEIDNDAVLKNSVVFTCMTFIASDISKMPANLEQYSNGYWNDMANNHVAIVKPNHYQNRMQFFESWILSKLSTGNAYILKGRDAKGAVKNLYVLDPRLVTPLVAENGDVYYQLGEDNLSGVYTTGTAVPSSEIIHDRYNCFFHPLVGLSPIFACGIAAMQGNNIRDNSTIFFGNMSRPSGILTAPGAISDATANRLKNDWTANYSGNNLGKVAVLADDLKYQPITISAVDSQMIEQLKFSGETICACFHFPAYKAGLGNMPTYNNIAALNQEYFSGCLQHYVESIELLLKEGLSLPPLQRINLDENALIRMDKVTQLDALSKGIQGIYKINEARKALNLPPVNGGDTPYLQQQNYSLAALDKRDNAEESAAGDVQTEALNGAQVTSLQGLIISAASGEIPKETVREVILAAFPLISQERVDQMLLPIQATKPADTSEDVEDLDDAKWLVIQDSITKGLSNAEYVNF